MPLEPRVLNSVVRISAVGELQGTGFIVGVPSEGTHGKIWPYLVTAHHVIRHQIEIAIEVPDPLTRGKLFDPVPLEGWTQPIPGVDLAIAPFPFDDVPRYQAFPISYFVPEGSVVPLGGTIYYLGMFAPLDTPMGRAGTLGALDVPITTRQGYSYHGDLVDCRSYGGFSGSPCISTMTYVVWNSRATNLPPGAVPSHVELGTTAVVGRFCGMFTAHYDDENDEGVVSRYGVGIMLPSDCILAALMTDEMKDERQVADKQLVQIPNAELDGEREQDG
jgi:hypothetical protein